MKKSLIFFTETTVIGGAEVYLQILALGLNKEQFNIRVAIPRNRGTEKFVDYLILKGIKVDYIEKYNIISNYFYFRKNKPDYIHFNVPVPVITCCTTAMLAGLVYSKSRIYVTEHMVHPEYKPNPVFRSIINFIYTKLDLSITVSNINKEALVKNFNLPEDKIKVIYNCVDIDHIKNHNKEIVSRLRSKFSINGSAIVFGTVGRLHKQKGHQYLIDAAKNAIKEVPNSVFLFVGTGSEKDQLIQKIKENNISDHFRIVGYQENLPEILALIDIFVLPSISEGLPFAVLEAMAARKPVIATNVGGVSEIITDNVDGILVESMDSDALAKAMILLAKDAKKRNHIAEMGQKKIMENFSLEKMISMTEEIYK